MFSTIDIKRPAWRTRNRRRQLVAVAVAALVVATLSLGLDEVAAAFIAAALLFAAVGCFILLRHLMQTMDLPERYLDERQLEHSRHYHYWAYRILVIVVAVLFIANILVPDDRVLGAMPAMVLLAVALPTFVAGWLEPDDPASDLLDPAGA